MSTSKKRRICASCRAGVSDLDDPDDFKPAEADYYVQGKVYSNYSDRMIPYRAYLCAGHMEMMLQDGAEFPVQRKL